MKILAHLDLDAFFAAVEELENPELREKPLVVGGDPHGRGVVSTANYAARKFGIHSAMSAAEALRRCPTAVFLRPRHALYRQYSRVVWDTIGEIVPRIERTGIDEGYLDLGTVAARLHASSGDRVRDPDGGSRTHEPDVLARRRHVEGRVQDRVRSAQARRHHGRPARDRGALPRAARGTPAPGRRARAPRRGCGPREWTTIGALAALGDPELRTLLPGSLGPLLRDRAQGVDPRDLDLELEPVSVSAEDTFARDLTDRERLHDEVRRLAELVSERLRNADLSGRTVTAKLRYGDFSIRTRSTTLPAAVDDAAVIGEVACGLLDRGLRDRPGALRLVGVGVSGLSPYRQLTLDES